MFAANAYGLRGGRACGVRHVDRRPAMRRSVEGLAELAVDRGMARRCDRMVANSPGRARLLCPARPAGGEDRA